MVTDKVDKTVNVRSGNGCPIRWCIAIIMVVVILALLLTVVILAVLLTQKDDSFGQDDVCQTSHCINTASRLLSSMRTEVDPCDDFYEFSCGQWIQTHTIPEDKGSLDTMEFVSDRLEMDVQNLLEQADEPGTIDPVRKAKQFYRSCMDQDTINKRGTADVEQFLQHLGGWPVLDVAWDESSLDLEMLIAHARQYTTNYVWPIAQGILMGLNILNDYKEYGKHVIYLDQPSLLLEGRDMYVNDTSPAYKAYIQYATNVAVAIGADPRVAATDMEKMVNFEKAIANISMAVSERRDMHKNYRPMNVSQLSHLYPKFNWLKFLQTIFGDAGITIDNSEKVVMWMKPYYDELFPLLETTPKRTVVNYILWRLIPKQFITMEEKFSLMKLEFRKVVEGIRQLKPRGRACSKATNDYMDQATGRMYAEKRFGPKEREHLLEMISYVRRIFKTIVQKATWMDDGTKKHALKKVEKMKALIGFPSFIFNNTVLTEYYSNITISSTNFFETLRQIRRHKGLQQLAELRLPSFERWPEKPAIVNAYYHSGLNAIVFPAGILQSPYYDINAPASINFGGIGLVIGHEITHGYDASGRSFDADGLLHNWWSNYSVDNFHDKAKCVIDHYSSFTVPNINMNINGNKTLSENIADIGGVKQSHLAYRLWVKENGGNDVSLPGLTQYTNEQLFFINTAQLWCSKFTDNEAKRNIMTSVHTIPMFRVLGELRNSEGFAEAFKCPKGSYMNPDTPKCSLW